MHGDIANLVQELGVRLVGPVGDVTKIGEFHRDLLLYGEPKSRSDTY
jgi:hypothetical protein